MATWPSAKAVASIMFAIGERIAIHPANDLFMRGAKYAEIVSFGRKCVHVKLDSGRSAKIPLRDCEKL